MPLIERGLWGDIDRVQISIDRVREFEPPEGYHLAFSGGKDSCATKGVADLAGVKYDAHYQVSTIDPPEMIFFMKREHPDVEFHHPAKHLLTAMVEDQKFPPTRFQRWCCRIYKEGGGEGRRVLTGIRWAESSKRNARKMVEPCLKDKSKTYVNPIIDWTDGDVWEFLKSRSIPYCKLYDEGFKRLGCIGCPMGRKQRDRQFARYPRFKTLWQRAFKRVFDKRKSEGLKLTWDNWEEMWDWWMSGERPKEPSDQTIMFE